MWPFSRKKPNYFADTDLVNAYSSPGFTESLEGRLLRIRLDGSYVWAVTKVVDDEFREDIEFEGQLLPSTLEDIEMRLMGIDFSEVPMDSVVHDVGSRLLIYRAGNETNAIAVQAGFGSSSQLARFDEIWELAHSGVQAKQTGAEQDAGHQDLTRCESKPP